MSISDVACPHLLRRSFRHAWILIFALGVLGAHRASAAICTVTDTTDNAADSGSIRYAINQVNAGSGGDVINFSGVTGTITLGSTLTISQNVTINGPGANILTISGNNTVRIFSISASATISGLTTANGSATDGAAVYTTNTLTVNNCTFFNNVGSGSNFINVGGAIINK